MDERTGASTSSRVQSLSPDVGRFSPGVDGVGASKKSVAKPFEWVQYGDPAARKRARAHVTRGYRRQQAEAAQAAKLQAGYKSKSPSASPIPQSSPISTRDTSPPEEANEETAVVLHSQSQTWEDNAGRRRLSFNPFIQRAIEGGNTDPFSALPIKLNMADHAVLTHYFEGVAPVSYHQDKKSDFSPVKQMSFDLAMHEPAGMHSICAFSATDMATIEGRQDSRMVLKHRGMSLTLANKKIAEGDASDGAIIGVALLAGYELLFGTPRTFIVHWNGMETLLKMRQGIENVRQKSQMLYDYIQWLDYTGACVFMARRRFAPAPSLVRLKTDPGGCLEVLLSSLPVNYDLFEKMSHACLSIKYMLELTIKSNRPNNSPTDHREQLTNMTNQSSSELTHLIAVTSIKGHKGRTQYIEQFMPTITMLIGIACLNAGIPGVSQLFQHLKAYLKDEQHASLVRCFANLCQMAVDPNVPKMTTESLHDLVEETLDVAGPWDWQEWQSVDLALVDFFLADRICAGPLQDMLRHQLISRSRG